MSASKKSSPQRFPDLYALLDLKPLESDPVVIAAALQRLENQLSSQHSPAATEESAARLAKLIELGKQHLLHPDRKTRYDRQWRQYQSQPKSSQQPLMAAQKQAIVSPTAFTAESPLLGLLPSGDPTQAFRREEYVDSVATLRQPDIDSDFEQLQRELRLALAEPVEPVKRGATIGQPKSDTTVAAASERAAIPDLPARQRGNRKRREKRILWLAIGGLTGLAALLAIGYRWSLPGHSTDVQRLDPEIALQTGASPREQPSQPVEPVPRRSGLPAVEGIVPDQDLTSNLEALVPVAPAETAASAAEQTAADGSMEPSPLPTPDAEMTSQPPAAAVVNDQIELTDAERAAWAAAMQQAKQLIGQQQYAAARQQLDVTDKLVKTPLQRSQLQRLDRICSLAEEFHQALQRAITGLAAGEVITIGSSTPVALVDSTEESITIRMRGENRKFLLTELPIGLAFALSDLSLDTAAASTLSRKAAFAWTHAGAAGNDVAAERAREMLATAVAEGAAETDLLQVFSDDYQLPALAPQTE